MKIVRVGAAVAATSVALCAASTFAGESVPASNHVHLVIERVADDLNPLAAFFVLVEVVLPAEAGVTQVTVTDPLGAESDLEEQDPGSWSDEFDFKDFASMKSATDGPWTIEIAGSAPSTSEFTVDLASLVESDLFPVPTIKAPTSGATGVSPAVVFSWSASCAKKAELINVEVEATDGDDWQSDSNFAEGSGSLTIKSTTWDPALDLAPGEHEFALMYLRRDSSNRASSLAVTNGAIAWGASPFAPEGYPASTPLFAMGCERVILFTVGNPCPGDLDSSGRVGFADLVSALSSWGPCPVHAACPADLDSNGAVGFSDLIAILTSWGPCKG